MNTEKLQELISIVGYDFRYWDCKSPMRIYKRNALILEELGFTESCIHYKGQYTYSKVTFNQQQTNFLKFLSDLYEAGYDSGFESGRSQGRSDDD